MVNNEALLHDEDKSGLIADIEKLHSETVELQNGSKVKAV